MLLQALRVTASGFNGSCHDNNDLPLSVNIPSPAGTAAWSLLATHVDTPSGAVVTMVVAALSTAASDVLVDSIVVERARGHPQVIGLL